jgi:hypothetical protein
MQLFLFFASHKVESLSSISPDFNLVVSQGVAVAKGVPLKVIFNMVPKFLQATLRQYDFMIKGLEEVEGVLRSKNIPFHLLMGDPVENVPQFALSQHAMLVVCDFSPLRVGSLSFMDPLFLIIIDIFLCLCLFGWFLWNRIEYRFCVTFSL